ncbi:hypothetical protein FSARC_12070 [Fusarium sarcochroum]|uniref:Uncharacterized protein n=1 Tax=Fusarium sarcochroum TaxID=1208366 RepID=A0A8H4TB30_9HYPO|nr:hypothetical protein FSARC_12070 [Fusarium sarcochroum]
MSLLTASAATILTKFGTSIAGAAGSWVFQQGLDALTGGSDTTKIQDAIAQIAQEDLLDLTLALRTDELKSPMSQITSYYDDITEIVQAALKLSSTLSAADRATQTAPIQARLKDRLKDCANNVPGLLDTINGYLTETGDATGDAFFEQIAQKTLDDSTDFLGFYGRSKAIIIQYWTVVAQGISLLQMASDVPGVRFVEGAAEVQRQTANLQNQDQVFRSTLGVETVKLAEQALNSTDPVYVGIAFCANDGEGILWATYADFEPRVWTANSINLVDTSARLWYLKFPFDTVCNYQPNGSYIARLSEGATNNSLVIDGSDIVVTELSGYENVTVSQWYVKPVSPGSDRFILQFQSENSEYNGAYLVRTAWGGGDKTSDWSLVTQETAEGGQMGMISLGKESNYDSSNFGYQWQITTWDDRPASP